MAVGVFVGVLLAVAVAVGVKLLVGVALKVAVGVLVTVGLFVLAQVAVQMALTPSEIQANGGNLLPTLGAAELNTLGALAASGPFLVGLAVLLWRRRTAERTAAPIGVPAA